MKRQALIGLMLVLGAVLCGCSGTPTVDAGQGGGTGGAGGGSLGGGGGSLGGGGGSLGGGGGSLGGGAGGGGDDGGTDAGGGGGGGGGTSGDGGLDTYVCGTCPGASDSNPGTQDNPVRTIGQGLRNAQLTSKTIVTVAAAHGTAIVMGTLINGVAVQYTEDVTMVPGVTLDGSSSVVVSSSGNSWLQNGRHATLQNTQAAGLKFTSGGRTTVLQNFVVVQAPLAAPRVAGITITGGRPLLRRFEVVGPPASSNVPVESVGIDVVGDGIAEVYPRLEGNSVTHSRVAPGRGSNGSTALAASNAVLEAVFTDFIGGPAGTISRGVHLVDSAGSLLQDDTMSGGIAPTCYGFLSQGAAGLTTVERASATGCPYDPNGAPINAGGAVFDACGSDAGIPVVRNSTIGGGSVSGTGSKAVGGAALDGCPVRFEGGTFTGLTNGETGTGLLCSYRGVRNATGADSRCSAVGVTAIGSATGSTGAVGLTCEGTCATQGAACRGSCESIETSSLRGESGHLRLLNSSPEVTRNLIGPRPGGGIPNCRGATGIELTGSASNLVNNTTCAGSIGVLLTLVQRADTSTPSPRFQNNTIVAANATGVGVRLRTSPGTTTALQGGIWRNNLIVLGPSQLPATQWAFEEVGTNADPEEVRNNLFFVLTPAVMPPLYRDEGSVTLTSASAINALTDSVSLANLEGDPSFVNASAGDFHITSSSSARAAGSTMTAPTVDIDNDARPSPSGSNPDIGSDEVN